uniref:WD_REPEATS_REGION domain-containing protein n=1 Tax=Syphacia muris TaxID=451379 RepID=A0A0N5ADP7_9BILA
MVNGTSVTTGADEVKLVDSASSKQKLSRERLNDSTKSYKNSVKKEKNNVAKLSEAKRRHRSVDTYERQHQNLFLNTNQTNLSGNEISKRKQKKDKLPNSSIRHSVSNTYATGKSEKASKKLPLKASAVSSFTDDFEEYSDDFEDSDITASTSQKQIIGTHLAQSTDLPNSPLISRLLHSRDASYKPFIDRKPSQTLIVTSTNASNSKNQYDALANLLGLEIVRFEFADIPPVNDYEFYMQMFGNDNKTQTHDDNNHRYVQTEDQEVESKWTQHPPTDERGWGVGLTKVVGSLNLNKVDTEIEYFRKKTVDNERLKNFLDITAEVIIKITSVPPDELFTPRLMCKSSLPYHLECDKFSLEVVGAKAQVSVVLRHKNDLFIAYFINGGENWRLLKKTVLVQYNLKTLGDPQRKVFYFFIFEFLHVIIFLWLLMICENEINCVCYATGKSNALFAGLNDGSCVAFDLSEPLTCFLNTVEWGEKESQRLVLCSPAYDTAFRSIGFEDEEDMRSSVIGINTTANISDGNSSYQVASISEFGTIFVWTVSEIERQDSLVDLGLRPGAKLKMGLASIIRLSATCSSQSVSQSNLNVRSVTYDPSDPFHFFIGTDNKVIFNFTRDKGWSYTGPQTYKTQGLPVEITCEAFSPFYPKIFLVGLSNGRLLFFKVERSQPILQLNHSDSNELSVTSIEFSPTITTKFYSICEKRYFFEWDLDCSKLPILTCDLLQCCLSTVESTAMWLHQCSKEKSCVFLALGLTNGELQLHEIEKEQRVNATRNLIKAINRLAV